MCAGSPRKTTSAQNACVCSVLHKKERPANTRQTPETEHLPYNERVPEESRMVKAFTRSSAGADVELVIDIRNPAACLVSHSSTTTTTTTRDWV